MKPIWLSFFLFCSGCAVLTADPWSWLDVPSDQKWVDVLVDGHDWQIRYSIPDRLKNGGQRTRFWPELAQDGMRQLVNLEERGRTDPFEVLGRYAWDWWWGGYFKKSGFDFTMSAELKEVNVPNLLSQSVNDRIEKINNDWDERYYRNGEISDFGRLVIDRLWVKTYKSHQGMTWVVRNNPAISADHVYYTIPITNTHILEFSFFVRDKRFGWQEDPEWNARRWALVEQIMNTVRITPDPYQAGSEPEAGLEAH